MGKLVRLIGSGIGFTSEAIIAARNRPSNHGAASATSSSRDLRDDYILADDAAADALIAEGRAELSADREKARQSKASEARPDAVAERGPELPAYRETDRPSKAAEAGYDSDEYSEANSWVEQDEAAWELDETAQRMRLPTYDESESAAAAVVTAETAREIDTEKDLETERDLETEGETDTKEAREEREEQEEHMRFAPPVIIPQRRPGWKHRGFVRVYAPLLADVGVGQDVFLQFLDDFYKASRASKWIEIIWIASGIVGTVPGITTMVTGAVVQTVAGTAWEVQHRHRANTFLDRANRDFFMPRGLYAMVIAFKDEIPGEQGGPLNAQSQRLGQPLFSRETIDINQPVGRSKFDITSTVAKYNTPNHPEITKAKQRIKGLRLASGQTHGEIELPEAAPLVYPDLDEVAARAMEGEAKSESAGPRDKLKGAGTWVQDYLDRKSQASFVSARFHALISTRVRANKDQELKHQGSSLSVPGSARKGFVSRYSDPNHPANNGNLVSVLTGGRMVVREKRKDHKRQKKPGLARKALQQDVLYLMIVNMPSQDEMQQSVAQLERFMQSQQPSLSEPEPVDQSTSEQDSLSADFKVRRLEASNVRQRGDLPQVQVLHLLIIVLDALLAERDPKNVVLTDPGDDFTDNLRQAERALGCGH
ncbi:uncharacterized protein N7459_007911 [Penicillium hispanicum]|uniref:uncharacterized protein n=1 Tax=Penicillium hispanicum TaxID=1080232 RepID=UPI00253FBED8|nr:uncharacterized protein N7459_007911 [Penicillium hispanicum]KAJ5573484.1 hypothetical protein N7459_007911 [Penicillium hispanicum]